MRAVAHPGDGQRGPDPEIDRDQRPRQPAPGQPDPVAGVHPVVRRVPARRRGRVVHQDLGVVPDRPPGIERAPGQVGLLVGVEEAAGQPAALVQHGAADRRGAPPGRSSPGPRPSGRRPAAAARAGARSSPLSGSAIRSDTMPSRGSAAKSARSRWIAPVSRQPPVVVEVQHQVASGPRPRRRCDRPGCRRCPAAGAARRRPAAPAHVRPVADDHDLDRIAFLRNDTRDRSGQVDRPVAHRQDDAARRSPLASTVTAAAGRPGCWPGEAPPSSLRCRTSVRPATGTRAASRWPGRRRRRRAAGTRTPAPRSAGAP